MGWRPLDGFERIFSDCRVPIIAMTANAMKSEEEACRVAGMDDFVPKPIDRAALFHALRKWISPPRASFPNQSPPPGALSPLPPPDSFDQPPMPQERTSIKIPGIEFEGTLKRLGVSQDGYLRMLSRFAAGQPKTVEALETALRDNDWETARRHAHSIAGAAGNLGAEDLRRLAKDLEIALKDTNGDVSQLFTALRAETEHVIVGIHGLSPKPQNFLASPTNETNRPIHDSTSVFEILFKLKDNLASGNLNALSEGLQELTKGISEDHTRQVKKLCDLIDGYEFEEATELVDELLNDYKVK